MTYQFRQKEPFESYSAFDPAGEFLSAEFDRHWQGEVSGKIPDRYVGWLQQSLNSLLKLRLVEDGDFGTKTRNALWLFRRKARLKSSGDVVCLDTEQALIAAGANPPPGMLQARASETTPPALTLYMDIPLQIRLGNAKSMTGIFVRDGFCPVPQVDVIVYLHGFKVRVHKPEFSVAEYWKLTEFLLREEVNKSQKNVILVAPTLGPRNQPGSLTCPGGFDNFLAQVMLALKQHGPYSGQQASPSIGNIILACHSGSGSVMRAIAMGADVSAQKIQECWAFEPANMGDASEWKKWAGSRSQNKLYIYYLPGTSGKRLCAALMGRSVPKPGQVSCAPNIFAEESSAAHDEVPRAHLKDRIQGAPFLLSKSSCSVNRPQKEWTGEDEASLNRPPYTHLGQASFNRPMHLRLPVRTLDYSTSNYYDLAWRNSPFELENDYEFAEVGNPPGTARAPARTARQIYASQTKVKPAVDANFSSIFSDRNKVVVIAFWADSCPPCAEAATAMTAVADRYSKGPAGPVKFYHVQFDPRVNPRVHQQFGFRSVPVVFFYYTSTGRPPSRAAPLLEGSLGHDEKHDPNRYVRTIEAILRRQAPAKVQSVSERRGWKRSTDLVSKSDFADIDQLLVEPSPFQQYLLGQYRANPGVRLSKLGIIQIQNTYESTYQIVNGRRPGPDNAGTFDKKNLKLYLLSVNIQLQTYLGRAIHEAIHMFCCPVKGTFTQFYNSYGFGITEGFTQYITEEILKSRKLAIIPPSPYKYELAAVTSLARVVGITALADDYFLCKKRVFEQLNRINKYSEFWRLSHNADEQREKGLERGMIEAYQKLIRFLDAINPQPASPASSTTREYLELPLNESGPGSNYENRRKALNHRSARLPESYFEDRELNNFNPGVAGFRLEGETADGIDAALKINTREGYVRGSIARRELDKAIGSVPGASAAKLHEQLRVGQDPIGILFRYRLHPVTQSVLLATLANKAKEFQQGPATIPQTTQCQLFLPAKAGNYEDYVAKQTTGRTTLMINGRDSGGPGPQRDQAEAFDSMQQLVSSLGPGDFLYLAAWQFNPVGLPLTLPLGASAVKTWADLLSLKATAGVKIRVIITENMAFRSDLTALNSLISKLSLPTRDNLQYIMSPPLSPGATHHQKFMVIKKSGATTAFCGGLDISHGRTPAYWRPGNNVWHDIHAKLEGLIARDLEKEFVLRWNREKNSSTEPMQPGWKPFTNLAQSRVSNADQNIVLNRQQLQMHRTVAIAFKNMRDDILQGYLRLIGCATRFIFMENQYFRERRIADAIVNQAKAHPELIVIIVAPRELDDPDDALLKHGNRLQYEFFARLFANLGPNQLRAYAMFKRWVHSKLIMADDHLLSVGSANCNPRGFFLDTELNVMLNDARAVESFRHRLWSHDLGVSQTTVANWRVSDFIARWDSVATANQALERTPDEMTGEGVIPFDHTKVKGERTSFPDVFFELNER